MDEWESNRLLDTTCARAQHAFCPVIVPTTKAAECNSKFLVVRSYKQGFDRILIHARPIIFGRSPWRALHEALNSWVTADREDSLRNMRYPRMAISVVPRICGA